MKIYITFFFLGGEERKFLVQENLKMKNHSEWKTLRIFNSGSFIIGEEKEEQSREKFVADASWNM